MIGRVVIRFTANLLKKIVPDISFIHHRKFTTDRPW